MKRIFTAIILIFICSLVYSGERDSLIRKYNRDSIEHLRHSHPDITPDHGLIYVETLKHIESGSDSIIWEPFNTATAAIFILIAIYWYVRIARAKKKSGFLIYCTTVLLAGGIGGTLYHGLRAVPLFMFIDGGAIGVLMFSFIYWLIFRLMNSVWKAVLLMLGGIVVTFALMFVMISTGVFRGGPTYGYMTMGIVSCIPLFLYLRKTSFRGVKYILLGILTFAIALFSRYFDLKSILPMGSHFIWHLAGAVATTLLFIYVWKEYEVD